MDKFLQVSQIKSRTEGKSVKRVSSREVAEMMDIDHSKLLRKIDGINKDFNQAKIGFVKYWTEGVYKDSKGEERREFQISKKGCEFLANKTTGTKGNLFTDRYMDKFEQMENIINNNPGMGIELASQMMNLAQGTQVIGQVVQGLLQTVNNMQEFVKDSIQVKDYQIDQAMDLIGVKARNVKRLSSALKESIYDYYGDYVTAKDTRYIKAREEVFREFNVFKWEDISVNQYHSVIAYIENLFA